MIFIVILFCFLIHSIVAYKSDTFPPMDIVRKHYDIDNVVKICYEKSGVDKSELHEFEVTTDLKHIPNSHALKVYLRCCGELTGNLDTQSNTMLLTKFMKFLDDLPFQQQLIYINMSKGCLARAGKVSDPLEYSYALAICGKKNDNEHFHIFY